MFYARMPLLYLPSCMQEMFFAEFLSIPKKYLVYVELKVKTRYLHLKFKLAGSIPVEF